MRREADKVLLCGHSAIIWATAVSAVYELASFAFLAVHVCPKCEGLLRSNVGGKRVWGHAAVLRCECEAPRLD